MFSARVENYQGVKTYQNVEQFVKTLTRFIEDAEDKEVINFSIFDIKRSEIKNPTSKGIELRHKEYKKKKKVQYEVGVVDLPVIVKTIKKKGTKIFDKPTLAVVDLPKKKTPLEISANKLKGNKLAQKNQETILSVLTDEWQTTGDIIKKMKISKSALKNNMIVLRETNGVIFEEKGNKYYYKRKL